MTDTNNRYEFTYIITPVLTDEQVKEAIKRVNKHIEDHGGSILEIDEWGSRRLAYPIKKKRNGYYVNMYFDAPGASIARLERLLEIDDNILRYLTLKMDTNMLRHYELRKKNGPETRAASVKNNVVQDEDDED